MHWDQSNIGASVRSNSNQLVLISDSEHRNTEDDDEEEEDDDEGEIEDETVGDEETMECESGEEIVTTSEEDLSEGKREVEGLGCYWY